MEKCAVVLALSVLLLLGGSSAAATFSSKLIHRFSDEAKVIWTARNGVVPWPKRNSLEYLELLIGNDWKRQRMKVGSKNQLLFPSQGSQTLSFGNELDWCSHTRGASIVQDKDLSEYTPSLSSSSKNLSCSHQLCESSSYCKGPNDPCPYIIEYNSANTSSSGYLVEDKLHLKSFIDHAVESSIQASVVIGCGRQQSGGYLDGAAPDGLMGLGPGNVSIPSLLAKAGLIQNSFSICLDETGSGRIYFGDKGIPSQQSTPFLPIGGNYEAYFVRVEHLCVGNSCHNKSGFLALVDSGTSFTYLPPEIYDKVVLEFDKQVNARRISNQEDPWKYCYNVSSEEPFKIPGMRLKFAMNQSFEVHNHIYSYTETEGFTVFCLTVLCGEDEFGVIGQNFMTGHRIVFDRENMTLGWSYSNCQDISDKSGLQLAPPPSSGSPIPLPTNEQQHNNHTDAVAPAVANSTKPSSASPLQIPTLLCLFSSFLLLLLRVLL
ncbi:hypothetical protein V6N13_075745 [Hibiscus sabdariffa]